MTLEQIKILARQCIEDTETYRSMRESGSERWELESFIQRMDDNDFAFTDAIMKLGLDNPAAFLELCDKLENGK